MYRYCEYIAYNIAHKYNIRETERHRTVPVSCANFSGSRTFRGILAIAGGGGGGILIFSYIRKVGPLFWFKILNFNNFVGVKYFWGYEKMCMFWGHHHRTCLYRGSCLYILGHFLSVKVQQNGNMFGVC